MEKTNNIPVNISINRYCLEISIPQLRHFPLWSKKENTGINSMELNLCPQFEHEEPGEIIDFPIGTLNPTTLKKEPNTRPSTKKIK